MSIPEPSLDIVLDIINELIYYGYIENANFEGAIPAVSRIMADLAASYRDNPSSDIQEQSEDLALVESAMEGNWSRWLNFETIHTIGRHGNFLVLQNLRSAYRK